MQIPYISRISVSELAVPLVFKMVLKIGILATALVFTSSATLAGGVLSANKKVTTNTPKSNALPVLQKHATSVSNASGGNYTVDWVVQYANTSGQTITNATVKDGAISTIIPGSLQQPAGWTGVTSSGNTIATWTGASVPPFGVMAAPIVTSGFSGMPAVSGKDGYIPIPYNHSTGQRIYMFNHGPGVNETGTLVNFQCAKASGGACVGWPKNAPAGDSSGENFNSFSNLYEEYAIVGSRLYYAVNKASNFTFGIACFDLETETECGYTPLGKIKATALAGNTSVKDVSSTTLVTANLTRDAILLGPWLVNNELYFGDFNGNVYCAKAGLTLSTCMGGTYYLPTSTIQLTTPVYDKTYKYGSTSYAHNQYIMGRVVGNKLYFATSTRVKHPVTNLPADEGWAYINCLNATTKTACWAGGLPTKGDGVHNYKLGRNGGALSLTNNPANNFIYYDAGGNAKALCQYTEASTNSAATTNTINSKQCFDLTTGASFASGGAMAFTLAPPRLGYGTEVHIGTRTYIPDYANDNVHCWDWATSTACDSSSKKYFAKSTSSAENYALNVDTNGCVWAYGNLGVLWNFDPNNLDKDGVAKPCGGSGNFTQTFQPLTYCSGAKPFHWLSVAVTGAPITNYTAFTINVLHPTSNAVLLTQNLMPAGPMLVDISSLDAQTLSQPLKIEVVYTPKPNVHDKPILEVHYDGPPMEFCFKSEHKCDQGPITNKVSTEFPDNQSARASFGGQSNAKAKLYTAQANAPTAPGCPSTCGTAGQPLCPLCDCLGNPVPVCGTPGQPPCPKCGQVGQPPCPACGQAGQPLCPDCTATPANGGGTVTPKNASQPRSSATNSSIYK
ncbi:MAG: hypothetical protein HOP25_10380 [Methylotenera sp.]|nr:hypothetical protein [Methylotenera sp.]